MLILLCEAALRAAALAVVVWLALKLLRPKNPRVELTAWTGILAASLAMPLLMQGSLDFAVAVPASVSDAMPNIAADLGSPVPADVIDAAEAPQAPSLPWHLIALGAYLVVTGALLARFIVALATGERIRRAATPLPDSALYGLDIRASDAVSAPLAFASTVLVPRDYPTWSAVKRNAVLAHEAAHIARGDFYVQAASCINRALFWFSPLSWWLHQRLAVLAENASDAAAIDSVGEPVIYAEVLFDFAQRGSHGLVGAVPMARPNTVAGRIEKILSGQPLSRSISMKKHLLIFASLLPLITLTAGLQLSTATAVLAAASTPGQARTVPEFHAVSFSPSGTVDIVVGKAQSVSLEADAELLERVTTEVRDGTLYIGRKNDGGFRPRREDLTVHVSVPRLDAVKVSGSGEIKINGLSGGKTEVGISGSGSLTARGTLDSLALDISGSGKADIPDLTVENAEVRISGSGNVKINARQSLDARISGSGDVRYMGSPRITSRVSGSGRIDRIN